MQRERRGSYRWVYGLFMVALVACGVETITPVREESQAEPGAMSSATQEWVTTLTFGASADARVEAAYPTRNFGGSSMLGADLSPQIESYLRFPISGVAGRVTQARLRLYASDGTSDGPQVYATVSGWSEGGLSWDNRPARFARLLDDKGAISSGSWVEFDVTGAVSGNGELNLALIATGGNGTDFISRESSDASRRPQLILTVESAPDCMPRQELFTHLPDWRYFNYVSQSEPDRYFFDEPVFLVDGSPRLESYIAYEILTQGMSVIDARLRLYATDSTSDGPLLYRASNDWGDYVTWNTRPSLLGAPVGDVGAISTNTWVEYELTGAITDDYVQSFALVPESTNGVDFVSFATPSAELKPQLRITLRSAPFCSYRGSGGGHTGWARQYGGSGSEFLRALATDSAGGFVAVGRFGSASFPGEGGFALARYSASGAPLWSRVVATQDVEASAVTLTPEGNILVAGNYQGSPNLGTGALPAVPVTPGRLSGFFIAKFSPSGATVWAHGFVARDAAFQVWPMVPAAVATDANGSLIVTGSFRGQVNLGGGVLDAGAWNVEPLTRTAGFLAKFSWQGVHLWSRAFEAGDERWSARGRSLATDAAGNVLVGGAVNSRSNLGDGPVGEDGPFIARYSPSGSLLWKRLFPGALGEVMGVQPLGTDAVAFSGNFSGTFTFAGGTYTGGIPDWSPTPSNTSAFIGTLSATGAEGWIRQLGSPYVLLTDLTVTEAGELTVSGRKYGAFDVGGGTLGDDALQTSLPFVARYSLAGAHLWSRALDKDFEMPFLFGSEPFLSEHMLLRMARQPGGAVLLGGSSLPSVELDGTVYTPSGERDLFYFQLQP